MITQNRRPHTTLGSIHRTVCIVKDYTPRSEIYRHILRKSEATGLTMSTRTAVPSGAPSLLLFGTERIHRKVRKLKVISGEHEDTPAAGLRLSAMNDDPSLHSEALYRCSGCTFYSVTAERNAADLLLRLPRAKTCLPNRVAGLCS